MLYGVSLDDIAIALLLMGSRTGGAAGIPAGVLTAGLACVIAQLAVNQGNIERVKYISSRFPPSTRTSPEETSLASSQSQTFRGQVSETHAAGKDLLDHALSLFGVTRLNDEEYLRKLKWQRERALKRISELEAQRVREVEAGPENISAN